MYKEAAPFFGGVGPREKTIFPLSGKLFCMSGYRSSQET